VPQVTHVQPLVYGYQEGIKRHGVRARKRNIGGKDAGTHRETLAVSGVAHTVTRHNGPNKPSQVLGMIRIRYKPYKAPLLNEPCGACGQAVTRDYATP
jgi:hypothetical protein